MRQAARVRRSSGGAGDGDRTRVTSLEGWGSTIELHPRGHPEATTACLFSFLTWADSEFVIGGTCVTAIVRPNGSPRPPSTVGCMTTMYERVGGEGFFTALVDRFYAGVAVDPVLRPLYPDDLTDAKAHLALFLAQYWGGPPTYGEQRGHPRLRMRHAPFVIGDLERDAWLRHMLAAVRSAGMAPGDEAEMTEYFEMAARQLMNAG